jgi:hypothetical protein
MRFHFLAPLILVIPSLLVAADKPDDKTKGPFPLVNPAKDITVLSDRDEPFVDFFKRQHVIVGGMLIKDLDAQITTKEARDKVFLNYTSHNTGGADSTRFGDYLKIAPASEAVAKLLAAEKKGLDGKDRFQVAVILRRDEKDERLFHLAGFTKRTPVGFFASDKKVEPDTFSPKELVHKGEKK